MFDDVGQFANVAGPSVLLQLLDRIVCERLRGFSRLGHVSSQQVMSQLRDVIEPIA